MKKTYVKLEDALKSFPKEFIDTIVKFLHIKLKDIKGFIFTFDEKYNFTNFSVDIEVPKEKTIDIISMFKQCGFSDDEIKGVSFKYIKDGKIIFNIENGVDITKCTNEKITDIVKHDINSFTINYSGDNTGKLDIIFANKDFEGYDNPGITDEQLLKVLLERNVSNKEFCHKIKEAIDLL